MAKFRALTLAIWLVIAIFATQSVNSGRLGDFFRKSKKPAPEQAKILAEVWEGNLFKDVDMSIEEIKRELGALKNTPWWSKPLVPTPSEEIRMYPYYLYYKDKQSEHVCEVSFFYNFGEYMKLVKPYPNIKKYINHLFDITLEHCKKVVLTEIQEFRDEKPEEWEKLEKIYSSIESSDPLYADLIRDGIGRSLEETTKALEDSLKAKTADVSVAYNDILDACFAMDHRWPVHNRIEVISKVSPKIEEGDEIAEYIRYHRLCKIAREAQMYFIRNSLLKQKDGQSGRSLYNHQKVFGLPFQ